MMSNSLIVLLALMVWIPFTLYYFRKEIFGHKKNGIPESGEINIGDCLGASKQAAVAKAAKPSPIPAMPSEPAEKPVRQTAPTPTVSSVPPSFPIPAEEREELPFYMAAEPGSMEVVHADEEDPDEWTFEQQDMQQSLREEEQLLAVEHDLRAPFRSEAEDRRIAEELHALQPYEVFNALREDARLRTQEILSKYPLSPSPEALPAEEEPLADEEYTTDTGKENTDCAEVPTNGTEEDGREEEGSGESETTPDLMNDFLS